MFFCRQLHVLLSFPVLAVSSDDFRIRLLWLSMIRFVVMLLNDAFHVIHTAAANFNCVFVENFVVPMVFRKVLLDQAQKYFSDICLDVLISGPDQEALS